MLETPSLPFVSQATIQVALFEPRLWKDNGKLLEWRTNVGICQVLKEISDQRFRVVGAYAILI